MTKAKTKMNMTTSSDGGRRQGTANGDDERYAERQISPDIYRREMIEISKREEMNEIEV